MIMIEKELNRVLGDLTRRKEEWKENISYMVSLLENSSPKITAMALWLLGEMGLLYPADIQPFTSQIASFLDSQEALLRERALNVLGRIGRGRFDGVEPYWERMAGLAMDKQTAGSARFHMGLGEYCDGNA